MIIVSCFCACSNSVSLSSVENSSVEFTTDSLEGMLRVSAKNAVAVLGTNDTMASLSERPSMRVELDYTFSIGRHEVTCAEFNKLMQPLTGLSLDCSMDELPATDVSYYDAILYANERSKALGFDTAYTYDSYVLDDKHHCKTIESLVFRPEVNAFRLPTEAEWVMVASKGWNSSNGWTSENSNYELHPVCTYDSVNIPVCDMAGNAMEWVNDWLGFFTDTIVSNYVGSPDGGSLGERIVKGGSFRNSYKNITLYGRGDVYTVTSSTRADYVGFRLAFGKIPSATWIGYNGVPVQSRVVPLAKTATLRALSNTYKMKLVFRNYASGNLSYIDYSSGVHYVAEIPGTAKAYHPDVSPNGRYIAYCTEIEGVSGKSELYVRELDLMGKGLVILKVESAAIPRWRILDNGDTAIVYVSDAGSNKEESSFKKMSTWQVVFKKGQFRTPVKLFDGAYHDGISEDNRLAVTGSKLLRARIAKEGSTVTKDAVDTVWYNGEQACNASLSSDGSKRTLFLDFGSKTGQAFVGEKYGTHERILIVDSTGTLIQSVASPEGFSFDHAEWVKGRSDFIVATLTNAQGAHTKVVLINMRDESFVELAEGDEIWHPSLWMNSPIDFSKFNLDADSAGVYMVADDDVAGILMRFNMELLWRYRDSANVVVVGSSRPLNGICPKCFSSKFYAVNLAHTPNSLFASGDFLDLYIYKHYKKLKYIIISLDIDFWYKIDGPEGDNFFDTRFFSYPGFVYDMNHNYWEEGYPEGLLEYSENFLTVSDEPIFVEDRGRLLTIACKEWGDDPEVDLDTTYFDKRSYLLDDSMDKLEEIIRKAQNKGIYVVGMIFPQSPAYKKTGSYGRHGLRRSTAKKLIERIKSLETTYDHFRFMDENKMGDHGYEDFVAADNDHLCARGAPILTEKVDSLLKTLD